MKKGTLVKYMKTRHPLRKCKSELYGVGIVIRTFRHLNIGHRASVHWSHGRVLNHPISFLEVVCESR
jgi:hypothetical protein